MAHSIGNATIIQPEEMVQVHTCRDNEDKVVKDITDCISVRKCLRLYIQKSNTEALYLLYYYADVVQKKAYSIRLTQQRGVML